MEKYSRTIIPSSPNYIIRPAYGVNQPFRVQIVAVQFLEGGRTKNSKAGAGNHTNSLNVHVQRNGFF
jgi:hypothetical protein